jgi:hypothetical protein
LLFLAAAIESLSQGILATFLGEHELDQPLG